jgi:hypothetical protein
LIFVWKLFFSKFNPLWSYLEARPRTLKNQGLAAKFDGLVRFGLPDSQWRFAEMASRDEMSFVKNSAAGESRIVVEISSSRSTGTPSESFCDRIRLGLGPRGEAELLPDGRLLVDCSDPDRLESVAHAIAADLGHASDAKYSCTSTGPTSNQAISKFLS